MWSVAGFGPGDAGCDFAETLSLSSATRLAPRRARFNSAGPRFVLTDARSVPAASRCELAGTSIMSTIIWFDRRRAGFACAESPSLIADAEFVLERAWSVFTGSPVVSSDARLVPRSARYNVAEARLLRTDASSVRAIAWFGAALTTTIGTLSIVALSPKSRGPLSTLEDTGTLGVIPGVA